MANGSIEYAEQTLGVHQSHQTAVDARLQLTEVMSNLAGARASKRSAEALLEDYQMELLARESGSNPDLSQAAMDRHMKATYSADELHKESRGKIREVTSSIDFLEGRKVLLEADIRIECARLVELGGYLTYLAAVKNAQPK